MSTVSKAVSKANTDAKISTDLTPALCFALVIQSAAKARGAALNFVYSVTAFMLNVVHLHDSGSDGYMNKADAMKYIKEELAKQASVKGGMLDHYVRTGAAIYDAFIGMGGKPSSLGAPIVKLMANAKNDEKALTNIIDEIDTTVGKATGAKSFREVSVALGFKSFVAKEPGGGTITTAQKASDRITTAVSAVIKASADHKIKGVSSAKANELMATAVAQAIPDPLATARECLNRVARSETVDLKQIEAFIEFCEGIVKQIEARVKGQKAAAKNAPKATADQTVAAAAMGKLRKGHVMHAGRGGK